MKYAIITLFILVLGVGGYLLFLSEDSGEEDTADSSVTAQVDDNSFQTQEVVVPNVVYQATAQLFDVTNGTVVRGVNTYSQSSGSAVAKYNDNNEYQLEVTFESLPDPENDDFYEGWLVNPGTGMFFSTGKVDKNPDLVFVDTYEGSEDYQTQGYVRYILTLEPNDGDPAPADHIVEGDLAI